MRFAGYRGRPGLWAWVLHRFSGVAITLFLLIHILDTALLGWGPDIYNQVIAIYHWPLFRVMEVFLVAGVIYHAFNGVRVILIDFWEGAVRIQEQLWYAVWVCFLIAFIPAAYVMLRPLVA